MQSENKLRWTTLCEQAAIEKDPEKLLELVQEINGIVAQKRQGFERESPGLPEDSVAPTESPSRRILLVDDSDPVRRLIKTLLAQEHPEWEIVEAENGQTALEKSLELQPDVVLLDLNLPDISGLDAVAKIRQLSPRTKIILCSLSDARQIAAIAQHARADGHFTKSSSPDELHRTIASVLSQSSAEK